MIRPAFRWRARKTFGGTCPECCGDLGLSNLREPKVVCLHCGESPAEPSRQREAERWLHVPGTSGATAQRRFST